MNDKNMQKLIMKCCACDNNEVEVIDIEHMIARDALNWWHCDRLVLIHIINVRCTKCGHDNRISEEFLKSHSGLDKDINFGIVKEV